MIHVHLLLFAIRIDDVAADTKFAAVAAVERLFPTVFVVCSTAEHSWYLIQIHHLHTVVAQNIVSGYFERWRLGTNATTCPR